MAIKFAEAQRLAAESRYRINPSPIDLANDLATGSLGDVEKSESTRDKCGLDALADFAKGEGSHYAAKMRQAGADLAAQIGEEDLDPPRPEDKEHLGKGVKKKRRQSMEDRLNEGGYLAKGGPFIGPRGGKWKDAQHTIPWKVESDAPAKAKRSHVDPVKLPAAYDAFLQAVGGRSELRIYLGDKGADKFIEMVNQSRQKNGSVRLTEAKSMLKTLRMVKDEMIRGGRMPGVSAGGQMPGVTRREAVQGVIVALSAAIARPVTSPATRRKEATAARKAKSQSLRPTKKSEVGDMSGIDALGTYGQDEDLEKCMGPSAESHVERWAGKFYTDSGMRVRALECARDSLKLEQDRAAFRKTDVPWRERDEWPRKKRESYQEKRDKKREAFSKRDDEIHERMAKLDTELAEYQLREAKAQQAAKKSDSGIDDLGAFAKGGGPFIGPRGGKWADAKHTIPWGEKKPAKVAEGGGKPIGLVRQAKEKELDAATDEFEKLAAQAQTPEYKFKVGLGVQNTPKAVAFREKVQAAWDQKDKLNTELAEIERQESVLMRRVKKSEDHMTGINALAEYGQEDGDLGKAQSMPTGTAKLGQGSEQGGKLDGVGETSGTNDTGPGPGQDAKGQVKAGKVAKDKLSEDDEEDEAQMQPHKKPIETAKSLTPARQRDSVAHETAQMTSKVRKGEADVDVGLVPPVQEEAPELEKGAVRRQGLLAHSEASDLACERLQKSEEFYTGGSPAAPAISQVFGPTKVCPQCHTSMSKSLTACPSCGLGTVIPRVVAGGEAQGDGEIVRKSRAPGLQPRIVKDVKLD